MVMKASPGAEEEGALVRTSNVGEGAERPHDTITFETTISLDRSLPDARVASGRRNRIWISQITHTNPLPCPPVLVFRWLSSFIAICNNCTGVIHKDWGLSGEKRRIRGTAGAIHKDGGLRGGKRRIRGTAPSTRPQGERRGGGESSGGTARGCGLLAGAAPSRCSRRCRAEAGLTGCHCRAFAHVGSKKLQRYEDLKRRKGEGQC